MKISKIKELELNKLFESKNNLIANYPEIASKINAQIFRVKDLGITSRIASHWEKMGIFFNTTPIGRWHTLNLIESVWIKMVIELRKFNISLETIIAIKENFQTTLDSLFIDHTDEELSDLYGKIHTHENQKEIDKIFKLKMFKKIISETKINIVEFILIDFYNYNRDHRFLITENGDVFTIVNNYSNLYLENNKYHDFIKQSHISISLYEIVKNLVGEIEIDTIQATLNNLSEVESEIITALREENIKKIEIIYSGKTKKPEIIKITKETKINETLKIKDLILSGGYQDIRMTMENGKVVHSTSTRKIKIK